MEEVLTELLAEARDPDEIRRLLLDAGYVIDAHERVAGMILDALKANGPGREDG